MFQIIPYVLRRHGKLLKQTNCITFDSRLSEFTIIYALRHDVASQPCSSNLLPTLMLEVCRAGEFLFLAF